MCEFCEEQKIIEFFDGKITWHIREKGKGYDMYYANSKTGELGIIDISYCPICGRKLTDGEVCMGVYNNREKEWWTRKQEGERWYTNKHNVIAWQPLPEPYKEEKKC